jgi:hypothetical protein
MIRWGAWSTADADASLAAVWKCEGVYFEQRPEMTRVVATWIKWDGGFPRP